MSTHVFFQDEICSIYLPESVEDRKMCDIYIYMAVLLGVYLGHCSTFFRLGCFSMHRSKDEQENALSMNVDFKTSRENVGKKCCHLYTLFTTRHPYLFVAISVLYRFTILIWGL